jgi:pyruvate formate lyase activating enzyme
LYPELSDLCRVIREQGLAVKLDTNGSRPGVLAQLIESGRLDFIAMDIKTAPESYKPALCDHKNAAGIPQSIDIIMKRGMDYEFRTTCVKPFINELIVERISRTIQGARRFTLQNFHSANLLAPQYLDTDPGFTPQQMQQLCTAAAPWVASCSVR